MLCCWQLARVLEQAVEHVTEASSKDLHHQHGLPVGHGETDPIAIEDKNARVQLAGVSDSYFPTETRWGTYVGADITTQKGNCETLDGGCLMGIGESERLNQYVKVQVDGPGCTYLLLPCIIW